MYGRKIADVMCRVLATIILLSSLQGLAVAGGISSEHCPSISLSSSHHHPEIVAGRTCCSSMACCPILPLIAAIAAPIIDEKALVGRVETPIRFLSTRPVHPPPKLFA